MNTFKTIINNHCRPILLAHCTSVKVIRTIEENGLSLQIDILPPSWIHLQ